MNTFNMRATANGSKPLNQQLQEQMKQQEAQEELEQQQQKQSALSFEWPNKLAEHQRKPFGIGMRALREKAGYTQLEVGQSVGVKGNYISIIEGGGVANIDKPLWKKIGRLYNSDLNELMMSVCLGGSAIKIPSSVAIAGGAMLENFEEQVFKVKGPHFELEAHVDERMFRFSITTREGQKIQIYEGKKEKDHIFFQGIERIISKIKKSI